jgi:hypothetical protein
MANTYNGLFMTIAAAFDEASKALDAPNALLGAVYQDFKPVVAAPYDTINLNYAASARTPQNVGNGSMTFGNAVVTSVPLQLNKHYADGFPLPSYEMVRQADPTGLRALFVDEAIKRLGVQMNQDLAALITAGNFPQVQAAAGDDTITPTEATGAWKKLADAKVPMRDFGNLWLLSNTAVYANLIASTAWTQESLVGASIAERVRTTAVLGRQWGALADYDLDMPSAAGVQTALFFHKNAMAIGSRPLEMPQAGGVEGTIVYYRGIPIRILIDFNQTMLATTVSVDVLYGVAVYKANHACRITTT